MWRVAGGCDLGFKSLTKFGGISVVRSIQRHDVTRVTFVSDGPMDLGEDVGGWLTLRVGGRYAGVPYTAGPFGRYRLSQTMPLSVAPVAFGFTFGFGAMDRESFLLRAQMGGGQESMGGPPIVACGRCLTTHYSKRQVD
eukprot:3504220-Pyramimonas_sp.AAC.1